MPVQLIRLSDNADFTNQVIDFSCDDLVGTDTSRLGTLRATFAMWVQEGSPKPSVGDVLQWTGPLGEVHILYVVGEGKPELLGIRDGFPVFGRQYEVVGILGALNEDYLPQRTFARATHREIINWAIEQRKLANPQMSPITTTLVQDGPIETAFEITERMRMSDLVKALSARSGYVFAFRGWHAVYKPFETETYAINLDESHPAFSPSALSIEDAVSAEINVVRVIGREEPVAGAVLWTDSPGGESQFRFPDAIFSAEQADFYQYNYHRQGLDTTLVTKTGTATVIATPAGITIPATSGSPTPTAKLTATRAVPFGFPLQVQSGSIELDEAVGSHFIACGLADATGSYVLAFRFDIGGAIRPIVSGTVVTPSRTIVPTQGHVYQLWLIPVQGDHDKVQFAFLVHDEDLTTDYGTTEIYRTPPMTITTGLATVTPVIIETFGPGVSLTGQFRAFPQPQISLEFTRGNHTQMLRVSTINEPLIDAVVARADRVTTIDLVNPQLDLERSFTLTMHAWRARPSEYEARDEGSIARLAAATGGNGIRRADDIFEEHVATSVEAKLLAETVLASLRPGTLRGQYAQWSDTLSAYPRPGERCSIALPSWGVVSGTARITGVRTEIEGMREGSPVARYTIAFGAVDRREDVIARLLAERRSGPGRFVLPPKGTELGDSVGIIPSASVQYDYATGRATITLAVPAGDVAGYEVRFEDFGWGTPGYAYRGTSPTFQLTTDQSVTVIYARAFSSGSPPAYSRASAMIVIMPIVRPKPVTNVSVTKFIEDFSLAPKAGFVVTFDRPAETEYVDLWMTTEFAGSPPAPVRFKETEYRAYRNRIEVRGLERRRYAIKLVPFNARGIGLADDIGQMLDLTPTIEIDLGSANRNEYSPPIPAPNAPTISLP